MALELASRGEKVMLLERAAQLMDGASRWNEGKIHLGYVYAQTGELRTARVMIAAAAAFGRFFTRHLECPVEKIARSSPFVYAVHEHSLAPADAIEHYFRRVDDLIAGALPSLGDYLGQTRLAPVREMAVDDSFDARRVQRAFVTPERSLDPHVLADLICARIRDDPGIELRTNADVCAIERRTDGRFRLLLTGGDQIDGLDQVVNASWESRLGLDASLGYLPRRPWLHRFKLAVHLNGSPASPPVPSVTFVLGPFGDIVDFGDGRRYLSWYPACRIAASTDLVPRDRTPLPPEGALEVHRRTVAALSALMPALANVPLNGSPATLRGGWIFAWGEREISDPASGLHERDDVGFFSDRGYHSINTGKYGMAPLNAVRLSDAISRPRAISRQCV